MKKFLYENGLGTVLFSIFLLALIGMSFAGWHSYNQDQTERRESAISYGSYITSGEFVEGVFENWESEFLQMWALVVLTIWLKQKGADDSKPLQGKVPQDTAPRYKLRNASTIGEARLAAGHLIYSHSLGLALLGIFILSFSLHAFGGVKAYNDDADYFGSEKLSTAQYVRSSQFWYESLQNWQSEFLAVGSLLVLSIKLRERGSPESKPVGVSYDHTTGK